MGKNLGISVGDIYTLVGFTINKSKTVYAIENGYGAGAFQENSKFFFVRMIVTDAINAETQWDTMKYADIFEVETSEGLFSVDFLQKSLKNDGTNAVDLLTFNDNNEQIACFGIIRSRVDEDLRSNESLHWATYNNIYGIDWQNLLLAWQKNVDKLGGSELILEGGGLAEADVTTTLPYSELAIEGNFVAATNGVGRRAILYYEGQAVMTTSNSLSLKVNSEEQTAVPNNLGSYSGALPITNATFKFLEKVSQPNSQWAAKVEISIDGATFVGTSRTFANDTTTGPSLAFDLSAFELQ